MTGYLDPQWTSPSPSGRILNPTGAVTVRDRSFNRLIYPVLSNAITHRLRYLSFWSWVVKNTDGISSSEQGRYEKLLLFSTKKHSCEEHSGLGERGLVGAGRTVEDLPENHPLYGNEDVSVEEFYTSDLDPLPLSGEYIQLTNTNGSGFENYYRNWMTRLFLVQDSESVTQIGSKLATAYADAHGISWERLESAVEEEEVSQALIQDLAGSGCLCSITETERQLCYQIWFGLINRKTTYDELDFSTSLGEHLQIVTVEPFLNAPDNGETTATQIDSDLLLDGDTSEDVETSLERYVEYGLDVGMRASQLLFLHSAHVTQFETQACSGDDHPLAEIRRLWRLHIQSEQFAWTLESLLGLFLDALQVNDPCRVSKVLEEMTTGDPFTTAVRDALGGFKSTTLDSDANIFDETQLGILYGTNSVHETSVTSTDTKQKYPRSWGALVNATSNRSTSDDPFDRDALSEWQLRRKIEYTREDTALNPSDRVKRACGYVAVLLARLQSRFEEYYSKEKLAPYRNWFSETVEYSGEPPNLRMIWKPTEYFEVDQTHSITDVTQDLLRNCLVSPYIDRLYSRMESGKIPQHFTADGTGRLRFERTYPSPDWSGYPNPSLSRLKWERNWDTLFELNLVSSHRSRDFEVTSDAEKLLSHVLGGKYNEHPA